MRLRAYGFLVSPPRLLQPLTWKRDRNFAHADWAGRDFRIVDTGGVVEGSDEGMDVAIRDQAMIAVEQADVILFLVDGKAGVQPLDERLAEVLRKTAKPVLLVVNKVDNLPRDQSYLEFWSLGIGEPIPVSALSGKGSGDLLDRLLDDLPDTSELEPEEDTVRVAVVEVDAGRVQEVEGRAGDLGAQRAGDVGGIAARHARDHVVELAQVRG